MKTSLNSIHHPPPTPRHSRLPEMENLVRYNIASRLPYSHTLLPYPPNEAAYTYVAAAIDIAQAILHHERTRRILSRLALKHDKECCRSHHFGEDPTAARNWINWFVGRLNHKFPPVVDFTIMHPDCLAYHLRMPWSGHLGEFDFRTRAGIHLNGEVRPD